MDRGSNDVPVNLDSLSVSQLWVLLWQILLLLHQYYTDPWEHSGLPPRPPQPSAAAAATPGPAVFAGPPASSFSGPLPSAPQSPGDPVLLNPGSCAFHCQFCRRPCSRGKPGHRHHRCRAHHDY